MRKMENILVTGGAGFIGSNFIRTLLNNADFTGNIVNLDKLTYAGNLLSIQDIETTYSDRYYFVKGDICNFELVESIFKEYDIDTVVHFAAESHVDRSIDGPVEFINTNIIGTFQLLEASRKCWQNDMENKLFHHISTDEVYGSLGKDGFFYETTNYDPRSPYSSSKASSDHLVKAYYHTYGLPITLSNCSNNYGPYQFPEKLIPLMISKLLKRESLPVYGDGQNIRDWLHVEDHNSAVIQIMLNGKVGETYNIGGENEWTNLDLVTYLCELVARLTDSSESELKSLITFVKDRPGHDRRYAINCDKLHKELNWYQKYNFEKGLESTAQWYLENREWVQEIESGEYQEWMNKQYS